MGWAKVDYGFFRNPKVVVVSKDARCLYIAGLCYCGENLTDGRIPASAVRILAAEVEARNPKAIANELVRAGLWNSSNDAEFLINDYLEFNESSDKRKAKQEEAKRRMQELRSQNVRANNERTNNEVPPKLHQQEEEEEEEVNEKEEVTTPPSPPRGESGEGQSAGDDSGSGEDADDAEPTKTTDMSAVQESQFEMFWSAFPRKEGKGPARKWWEKRKPTADVVEKMLASIEGWKLSRQWQKNNGEFVPMASTWLNQNRWEDDIPPPISPAEVAASYRNGPHWSGRPGQMVDGNLSNAELEAIARGEVTL